LSNIKDEQEEILEELTNLEFPFKNEDEYLFFRKIYEQLQKNEIYKIFYQNLPIELQNFLKNINKIYWIDLYENKGKFLRKIIKVKHFLS